MNSQYEKGMTWDSRDGLEGMHTLDARPDKFGKSTDTYISYTVEKLIEQDSTIGAVVVDLAEVMVA